MKSHKLIITASILLLTACQTKQPPTTSTTTAIESLSSEAPVSDYTGTKENTDVEEALPHAADSSSESTDTFQTEAANNYTKQDIAGTWHINGQKTQDGNERSLQEEFGTGLQYGNELLLSENGEFSYYIGIGSGGKGSWSIEGNTITADFTTYEPEVREEQLTMTIDFGEDGEIFIKMTQTDGYILFWNRQEDSPEITSSLEHSTYPASYMITTDNYFDYQPGLECSAFSSAYLLRHYGEKADGLELYKTFPGRLSGGGAMPYGITDFFTERGFNAEFKNNGTIDILKEMISLGNPVIVFIHVKEPYKSPHNTHYIPLIGYDNDYLYFAESLSEYANCKDEENLPYNRKTEISKFERLWSNIDATWDYPYFEITIDD